MDEEDLIASVLRLRLNGESVAQVAALLEQEGTSVPLSQVKKACSKAAKRSPAHVCIVKNFSQDFHHDL